MMSYFQDSDFNTGNRTISGYDLLYTSTLSYDPTVRRVESALNLSTKDSSSCFNGKRILDNVGVAARVPISENGATTSQEYIDVHTEYPLDLSKTTVDRKPSIIDQDFSTILRNNYDDRNIIVRSLTSRRRIIQCHFCTFKTDHKNNLRKHMTGVHLQATKVECPRCGMISKHKYSLATHLNYCGKEPRFHCAFCPQRCTKRHHLQRHMLRKHSDKSIAQVLHPTTPSKNCPTRTTSPLDDTISSQQIIKEDPVSDKKECPCCGRGFQYWGHMQRHYKSCSAKCIQCKYCPYKAKDNAMLQIHIYSVHSNDAPEQTLMPEITVKTEQVQ